MPASHAQEPTADSLGVYQDDAGKMAWSGAASAIGEDEPLATVIYLAIPFLQIGATVSVEQAIARRRVERGELSVRAVPAPDGSLALMVSKRF